MVRMAAEGPQGASLLCSRGRHRLPARLWVLGAVAISLLSLRPGQSFHSCQILTSLGSLCNTVRSSAQSMRRLSLRTHGGFALHRTGRSRAGGSPLTCAAVPTEGVAMPEDPSDGPLLDGPEEAFLDGEGMVMSDADQREALAQARPLAPPPNRPWPASCPGCGKMQGGRPAPPTMRGSPGVSWVGGWFRGPWLTDSWLHTWSNQSDGSILPHCSAAPVLSETGQHLLSSHPPHPTRARGNPGQRLTRTPPWRQPRGKS